MSIRWQGYGRRGPLSRSRLFLQGPGECVALALLALVVLIASHPQVFAVSIPVGRCLAIVVISGMTQLWIALGTFALIVLLGGEVRALFVPALASAGFAMARSNASRAA